MSEIADRVKKIVVEHLGVVPRNERRAGDGKLAARYDLFGSDTGGERVALDADTPNQPKRPTSAMCRPHRIWIERP